jgi:hypothetical protein
MATDLATKKDEIKEKINKIKENNSPIDLKNITESLRLNEIRLKAPSKDELQSGLNEISKHVDLKLGSFVIPIVMYCLSFPYILNNKSSSEYISWVLIFFLNVVFPFTYMKELFQLGSKYNKKGKTSGKIVIFSIGCIFITYLLQFIVLVFVLIKNENVRKGKEKRGEYKNEEEQSLNTKSRSVERRDRIVSILFITGTVLTWAMVGNIFGYDLRLNMFIPTEGEVDSIKEEGKLEGKLWTPQERMENMFPIGSKVHWLIHLIPNLLRVFDGSLHSAIDWIPLKPLHKALFVYIVSFLVILFSVFIRVKYERRKQKIQNGDGTSEFQMRIVTRKEDEIVNVSHLFGKTFYSQIKHIRRLAIVSLVFLIILIGIIPFMLYLSYKGIKLSQPFGENQYLTPLNIIIGWCILAIVILFPAFFAEKKETIDSGYKNKFDHYNEKKRNPDDEMTKNEIKSALFPIDDGRVYYKKEINIHDVIMDNQINIYFNQNHLLDGIVTIKEESKPVRIDQAVARLGHYFETHLFPNSGFNVVTTASNKEISRRTITGTSIYVNIDNAWNLVETKYKNLDNFDIDISPEKEQEYDILKTEFRSIMEQIYAQEYSAFRGHRKDYDTNNPYIEKPFVYEDTEEYKIKSVEHQQKGFNMPLKRYIFFLVCLFFGFISSPVLLALIKTFLGFLKGIINFNINLDTAFTKNGRFTFMYLLFSCILTLIMFLIGVDKPSTDTNDNNDLIHPSNHRKMKTFLAILWSMVGASFFALSTQFNMFSALWSGPGTIISVILKTVAPLAILLFAALSLFYAFQNYKRYKYATSE